MSADQKPFAGAPMITRSEGQVDKHVMHIVPGQYIRLVNGSIYEIAANPFPNARDLYVAMMTARDRRSRERQMTGNRR